MAPYRYGTVLFYYSFFSLRYFIRSCLLSWSLLILWFYSFDTNNNEYVPYIVYTYEKIMTPTVDRSWISLPAIVMKTRLGVAFGTVLYWKRFTYFVFRSQPTKAKKHDLSVWHGNVQTSARLIWFPPKIHS